MSRRAIRTLLLLIVSVMAGAVAFYLVPQPLPELSRAELMDEIRAGHVHDIEIEDQSVILGKSATRGGFRSAFDKARDAGLPDELRALGIEIRFTRSSPGI